MISVVITTYGRPKFLEEAIKSILTQKKLPKEVIIVDDNGVGTVNNLLTKEIVNKLSNPLIKLIEHNINEGANKARNTGVFNSKGAYIAFLDDDDIFYKDKIYQIENIIKEKNDIDLIYSGAKYKYKYLKKYKYVSGNDIKFDILKHNFIGSNSFCIIKKATLIELGGFDENLTSCQDWDMWTRIIFNNGKIQGIDKALVEYRVHDGSRISSNGQKKIQGHRMYFKKIEKYLKEFNYSQIELLKMYQLKRLSFIDYSSKDYKNFLKKYEVIKQILNMTFKDKVRYKIAKIKIKMEKLDEKIY